MSITTCEKVEINTGAEDTPGASEHDEATIIIGGIMQHLTELLKDLSQMQQESFNVLSGNNQHVSVHLS